VRSPYDPLQRVMFTTALQEGGTISVWNNGPGIPVRRVGDADGTDYSTAGASNAEPWVPQMIFGELLTGSNYDDNEQKVHNQTGRTLFARPCSLIRDFILAPRLAVRLWLVTSQPVGLLQTTGGRNGYGAKLANIYSSRFVVETSDGRLNNRSFKQARTDLDSAECVQQHDSQIVGAWYTAEGAHQCVVVGYAGVQGQHGQG
jgi:DNA topoisomerase II